MPLRPELGGFGMFPLSFRASKLPSSLSMRINADDDSGQDKSFRSQFPSWFLQDTLLGFSEVTGGKVTGAACTLYAENVYAICVHPYSVAE